jgi:hypothetical protein
VGRTFWRVWLGESVSGLGDAAFAVAFSWLVLSTTGSTGVLAATLSAGAVTRGVLLLIGGAVVDRLSARTVLLTAHVVRGVAVGGLAAAATGRPPGRGPGRRRGRGRGAGRLRRTGRGHDPAGPGPGRPAAPANALVSFSEQVAFATGPLAADALVATSGPAAALAADAATFALAAVTLLGAPTTRAVPEGPMWTDIRAGLAWAWRTPEVRAVLVVVAAATLSYAGLFGVGLPALARSSGVRSGWACCCRPGAWASWSARSRPG